MIVMTHDVQDGPADQVAARVVAAAARGPLAAALADLAPGDRAAPWPYAELDVAAARAAGHRPVPFRELVLKVHQRCNLAGAARRAASPHRTAPTTPRAGSPPR